MALADRLKEAPEEVKDVFARGRAALSATEVTGEWTEEQRVAIEEMVMLRIELGWEDDDE